MVTAKIPTRFVNLFCSLLFCMSALNAVASVNAANPKVVAYNYPQILPKAADYRLKAEGIDITVGQSSCGAYAAFSCEGPVNIEIELPYGTSGDVTISPKKHGILPRIEGNRISFQIPGPMLFAVMVDGLPALYGYANPLETNVPDASDPKVKYFKAGQIYEVGQLVLSDDETLYIEGGAVVRGSVFASSAKNIRIAGYGILDGGYYAANNKHRSILLEDCRNSVIEDIIMIEPSSWMIVLGLCEDIVVRNVKQLGFVSSSDGVDIVGCKRVKVLNSFLRNGDDCVVVKAFDLGRYNKYVSKNFSADVDDIEVNNCIVLSFRGGQAFEIGHELTTASVRNIRFINCDVLGVHDQGGVFGIHNTDRAAVSDVLYQDIRVEHYYNKLVDIRIIKSRYFRDEERGQIRNVTFKNIDVTVSEYNPGYSISLIGGYDAKHTVENVVFDNFRLNGTKVTNADQLDLFLKQTKNVTFR